MIIVPSYILMKLVRTFTFPILSALFLLSVHTHAQEVNCADKYQQALEFYNFGMTDSALNTLIPCMESKQDLKEVPNETSANIFRLAALSSILTGDPVEADHYITRLLQYQPDYKENFREDDLEEFRLMVLSKSVRPSILLGLRIGFTMPFSELQKNYTYPEKPLGSFALENSTSFHIGLSGEKAFNKYLSMELGAGITQFQFKYLVTVSRLSQYQYDQKTLYLELPVLCKYYFAPKGALRPYLQGGTTIRVPFYKREKSDEFGKYWFTESSSKEHILATFRTDMENIGLVVGGGISYDLKKISFSADIRYSHFFKSANGLSNFDDINGYEDISPSEPFRYTDDIILITANDLQISLGFAYFLKYTAY